MNRRGGRLLAIVRLCGAILVGLAGIGFCAGAQAAAFGPDTVRGMIDTLEVAQFLSKNMLFSTQTEDIVAFGEAVLGLLDTSVDGSEPLLSITATVLEQHAAAEWLDDVTREGFEAIIARVQLYLGLAASEIREIITLSRDRRPLVGRREKVCAYLYAAMGDTENPFVPDGLVDAAAMLSGSPGPALGT